MENFQILEVNENEEEDEGGGEGEGGGETDTSLFGIVQKNSNNKICTC